VTAPRREELDVYVGLGADTVLAGRVAFIRRRSARLATVLTYDPDYLADDRAYPLAPDLRMDTARHTVDGLPGAFADTAPDWWGRNLISRRLRAEALASGRRQPVVSEVDYLLGVSDVTRQGALRFTRPGSSEFLAADADVPKVVELEELLRASDKVATDPDDADADADQAVKVLLAAGTGTLGGARPKASVVDGDRLLIAKFPHPVQDEWDVMGWEKTALDLAERAGIPVPERRLEQVGGRTVLLLARFDRTPYDGGLGRVGYVSASTLIGGERTAERDYLDVQAAIEDHSGGPDADFTQMWLRIVFSVAIHNTDDHLRNYGFLRTDEGWQLSPAFDVNPNPEVGLPRSTAIGGETMQRGELAALLGVADYFGLSDHAARQSIAEVFEATADWRDVAMSNGVPNSELRRFEGAFDGLRDEAMSR